jgi:hypothetical protein
LKDWPKAAAAYNFGAGALKSWLQGVSTDYRDPALQQAANWFFGFLEAIAIACQIAGWRMRRFSLFAVMVSALSVCFAVTDSQLEIIQTCCG